MMQATTKTSLHTYVGNSRLNQFKCNAKHKSEKVKAPEESIVTVLVTEFMKLKVKLTQQSSILWICMKTLTRVHHKNCACIGRLLHITFMFYVADFSVLNLSLMHLPW